MRSKFLLVALLILPSLVGQGQNRFKVLHAFGAGTDGAGVWDSVTLDAQGNVYGATNGGGTHKDGTIFRLTPMRDGCWKETILHNFPSSTIDGGGPFGGVLVDVNGNLYGMTMSLGTHDRGVAFQLAPSRGGWREEILHSFCSRPSCEDGGAPWGNLMMDSNSDLYGTGYVAFELARHPKGWWGDTTIHVFTGKNGDGSGPQAGPIRDAAGNLYGTTRYGGGGPWCAPDGCGVVWELSPPADSGNQGWTERILYRFGFSRTDGDTPSLGQLAMDREGNLYGAAGGGKYKIGIVFKLSRTSATPGGPEVWSEKILYNFGTTSADGAYPGGGVILDSAGNLYGTTIAGGFGCGCGVVFKLSPTAHGAWKYTLLHTFQGTDGAQPDANLTLGPDGKLYGTTATGGPYGGGVVFQLTP